MLRPLQLPCTMVMTVRPCRSIRAVVLAAAVGLAASALGPGYASAAPAKGKPPAKAPAAAAVDVNDLSLRVQAMESIYEFDLSDAQLSALRAAATGAAQAKQRTAAKSTPKLVEILQGLQAALAKQDAEKVQDLRPQVDEAQTDEAVELDDDVVATDAARAKAPGIAKQLKASQIAAYLAEHADEVADPVEQLMDALNDVRDPDAEGADEEMQATAEEVGQLVAGSDAAKSKRVTEQALAWLKANKGLTDDQFASRHDALEASAKKLVGDVSPIQVLSNWLDGEIAELLSNPQLPAAIDAMVAGRKG